MIELKSDDRLEMDSYLEDAIADAYYALDEIIELMDYEKIYNLINSNNQVITYEDIIKAQEVLNLLNDPNDLKLIKIKV